MPCVLKQHNLLLQARRDTEDGSIDSCEAVVPIYQTAHCIPKNHNCNLDSNSAALAIVYRHASVEWYHVSTFVIFKQHVVLLWFVKSYFGLWISNKSISLFHLSLIHVTEIHDGVKQKFVVYCKRFLNVVSCWNVCVRSRNLKAPFRYNNYVL